MKIVGLALCGTARGQALQLYCISENNEGRISPDTSSFKSLNWGFKDVNFVLEIIYDFCNKKIKLMVLMFAIFKLKL
jgi:hypothetical protein